MTPELQGTKITPIGRILKTHGIKGEINAVTDGIDPTDLHCLVLLMNGIPVPFFIEAARQRGAEGWLLTLQGFDSQQKAAMLVGKEIYALETDIEEPDFAEGFYIEDLVGFKALEDDGTPLGEIIDVDTSTDNILLIIQPPTPLQPFMVPAVEEFFSAINPQEKTITLSLPQGLRDLN